MGTDGIKQQNIPQITGTNPGSSATSVNDLKSKEKYDQSIFRNADINQNGVLEGEEIQNYNASYEQKEILQKQSAKQIYDELKSGVRLGFNNYGKIESAIDKIDNPIELQELNRLLKEDGYKGDNKHSPIEEFMVREFSFKSDSNFGYMNDKVQKWINDGTLQGESAIDAQVRLALRNYNDRDVSCLEYVKAPTTTGDPQLDAQNAEAVYKKYEKLLCEQIDRIYGKDGMYGSHYYTMDSVIRRNCDWDKPTAKNILAKNGALGNEKINAVYDFLIRSVDGGGTNISELKEALKTINSPQERQLLEEKLQDYCIKHNIKTQYQGQSYLQAILYDECDKLGVSTNHDEIRQMNQLLIDAGAYDQNEIAGIKAEQIALQILEGNFDNIDAAIKNITSKQIFDKVNLVLAAKGEKSLNNFLSKNVTNQTKLDLLNAQLASQKLIPEDKAIDCSVRLLTSGNFDSIAQGLRVIQTDAIADKIDEKLKEQGTSLINIINQFNSDKAERIKDGQIIDTFGLEHIAQKLQKNTDGSDNLYVESSTAQFVSESDKQNYDMTLDFMKAQQEYLDKAFDEAKSDQGALSALVNEIFEIYNIDNYFDISKFRFSETVTRSDIEKLLEHNKETIRLLEIASEGKLVDRATGKHVSFEDIFSERQIIPSDSKEKRMPILEAILCPAVGGVINICKEKAKAEKSSTQVQYNPDLIQSVTEQGQKISDMTFAQDYVPACWTELSSAIDSDDVTKLSVSISNTLDNLSRACKDNLSLEVFGYTLQNGAIVRADGTPVDAQELNQFAQMLKTQLGQFVSQAYGLENGAIRDDMTENDLKDLMKDNYDEQIKRFKDDYKAAFGQEPSEDMIKSYVSTIDSGVMVLKTGALIVATVVSGGAALPTFAAVAGTSLAMSTLEDSTDGDGLTEKEFNNNLVQATADGVLIVGGMEIAGFAAGTAQKFATWLNGLPKHAAVEVNKALAMSAQLGIAISGDTLLATCTQLVQSGGEISAEQLLYNLKLAAIGTVVGTVGKNVTSKVSSNPSATTNIGGVAVPTAAALTFKLSSKTFVKAADMMSERADIPTDNQAYAQGSASAKSSADKIMSSPIITYDYTTMNTGNTGSDLVTQNGSSYTYKDIVEWLNNQVDSIEGIKSIIDNWPDTSEKQNLITLYQSRLNGNIT